MHVLEHAKNIIPHIRGKSAIQIYSPQQLQNFQFWNLAPGSCLGCGRQMSQTEMNPPGRQTPRAYCEACWQNVPWGACQVCLRPLDHAQQMSQRNNPLDLHTRVHHQGYMANEYPCLDLFAVGSAHVLGVRVGLIETEQWYQPQRMYRKPVPNRQYQTQIMAPMPTQMQGDPDVMDAEYYEIVRQLPPGMQRSLPPPDNSMKASEFLKKMRGGVRPDGKEFVYVPLKNQHR